MATDTQSPVVLVTVPYEFEAMAIVDSLEAHGISARQVGGYTSSFQVEIAGGVQVVVSQSDVERATEILGENRGGRGGEADSEREIAGEPKRSRFQFSLLQLLAVQTILCLIFALTSNAGPLLFVLTLITVAIGLIIWGTVCIASGMNRARQAWSYSGGAMLIITAMYLLALLIVQFVG